MSWLLPALIAPAIYAASIFIDKYVVEHKVKDSRGIPIYSAVAAAVFGTILWLILGRPVLSLNNAALIFISGIFAICALAFYFYALSRSHASYINAVLQMMPVFLLIMALVFLGEHLNGWQILGFIVIFGAVMGLSVERDISKFRLNKAFWAVLISSLLFAISAVIIKFTTGLTDFGSIMIYESWGLALGGVILFASVITIRQAFLDSFKNVGRSTMGIMFFNEGLFIGSKALTFLAIVLGPVSLVGVLEGTQVFYGLMFGVILTLLFPKIFHESVVKKEVATKVALSAALFIGVWLIAWS
jgi:drug/metabolite transporter (DMT)-like permease